MTLDLPGPIAAYFAADLADGNAVAQCFIDNAVVKDEGHTYNGRAAIKNWKADTAAKFQYKEPQIHRASRETTFQPTRDDGLFTLPLQREQFGRVEQLEKREGQEERSHEVPHRPVPSEASSP